MRLSYPPLTQVHNPGHVTGTMHGACHIRYTANRSLPDPRCTFGSFDPAMTKARICAAGYRTYPKDKVENKLHAMVCAGKISLHNAQLDIAHNWTTAP